MWAYITIEPSSLKEPLPGLTLPFITQQGISIPPQSCLQCRQWLLASTEIDPPRAILEYSPGKWPTFSSLFNSLKPNLLNRLWTLFEELMSENKIMYFCIENVDVSCSESLLVFSIPSPDQMPSYYATNEPKRLSGEVLFLHVNSIEKWTEMKNSGLKIPEKDQIYVCVGFSYY